MGNSAFCAAGAQRGRPLGFDGSSVPLSHHRLDIHSFRWLIVGCTFFTFLLLSPFDADCLLPFTS